AIRQSLRAVKDSVNRQLSRNESHTVVICSDLKSSIAAIQQYQTMHPIVNRIKKDLYCLESKNIFIIFCWVPSHVGVSGNEEADKIAKSASRRDNYA
ncbi:RNase H family protein, partial [Klebsiella pneumoniae]|uniref:RNase H family protein n=1 Tax=Klebsiella pneumoniae TaxID=573 RepID=UPI003EB8FDA2